MAPSTGLKFHVNPNPNWLTSAHRPTLPWRRDSTPSAAAPTPSPEPRRVGRYRRIRPAFHTGQASCAVRSESTWNLGPEDLRYREGTRAVAKSGRGKPQLRCGWTSFRAVESHGIGPMRRSMVAAGLGRASVTVRLPSEHRPNGHHHHTDAHHRRGRARPACPPATQSKQQPTRGQVDPPEGGHARASVARTDAPPNGHHHQTDAHHRRGRARPACPPDEQSEQQPSRGQVERNEGGDARASLGAPRAAWGGERTEPTPQHVRKNLNAYRRFI